MAKYDHKAVEKKWRQRWQDDKLYQLDLDKAVKPYYNLMMFPYPSAEGLHVGNMYAFVHSDAYGRFMRLKGLDVFEPIGLDGFGIHSENYAIKIGEHIKTVSARTEKHFYQQLHQIGNAYDWSRTVETYKPDYYKWTQWLFLKMYEQGLAYRKMSAVNWCPSCKTVLSDEQVIAGRCERCGTSTEKKQMEQWFWRITDYAERLLQNLEVIDWTEEVKTIQKNWIGKSQGAYIKFSIFNFQFLNKSQINHKSQISKISNQKKFDIEVFTTRPDTLFGATYLVLSPEHSLIEKITSPEQKEAVAKYRQQAAAKSDLERTDLAKEKSGVFSGAYAINPVNKDKIPVWIADYVLMGYGTGAIMAVPAHDQRDWEFARKYNLPILQVVEKIENSKQKTGGGKNMSASAEKTAKARPTTEECFSGAGLNVNSDFLNGLPTAQAKQKITDWLEQKNLGQAAVTYKLRDWCVSRQRYWGPPIPMIYCAQCAKKQQENAIIFHGWEDNAQTGFIPALKNDLAGKGYQAVVYDAPNTEAPQFDQWYKFAVGKIDQMPPGGLNIIGHSMGGLLALKLAEKYLVNKLVLVAPVGSKPSEEYFKQYVNELAKEEMEIFRNYQNRTINIKKIKQNIKEMILVFGGQDQWITREIRDFYKKNFKDFASFKIFDKAGHMGSEDGAVWADDLKQLFGKVDHSQSGWQPVREEDLPVMLPEVDDFLPDGSGKGPLNKVKEFVNTTCPSCGGPARRETDVSDPFVDSSWYFLRYLCTDLTGRALDNKRLAKWLPVDMYIGGKEHSVLHLLYSRFVTMVMHELGYAPEPEPFQRFRAHGLLISQGAKMSKSKGNVINPDEYIDKFGADAVRMYLLFLGDMRQGGDWSDSGMAGMYRFVKRIYKLWEKVNDKAAPGKTDHQSQIANSKQITNHKSEFSNYNLVKLLHKTVKGVGQDLENLKFNTAIAKLMTLANEIQAAGCGRDQFAVFLIMLAPFAPHLAEEMWSRLGNQDSIFKQLWPGYDAALVKDQTINLVVQINGKVRDKIEVAADIAEPEAKQTALDSEKIKKWIGGKKIVKFIFIKGKLINIVIS